MLLLRGEENLIFSHHQEKKMREDGFPITIEWNGEEYEVPSFEEIESWVYDSVCETPDGCRVEPDHPDSWLRILGLI